MTGVLHTARINAIKFIVSSDKLIMMVNFKLGNEMWRWINQHDMSVGQRKILSPTLVSCWLIHLHISLPSLKFTIIIYLYLGSAFWEGWGAVYWKCYSGEYSYGVWYSKKYYKLFSTRLLMWDYWKKKTFLTHSSWHWSVVRNTNAILLEWQHYYFITFY